MGCYLSVRNAARSVRQRALLRYRSRDERQATHPKRQPAAIHCTQFACLLGKFRRPGKQKMAQLCVTLTLEKRAAVAAI